MTPRKIILLLLTAVILLDVAYVFGIKSLFYPIIILAAILVIYAFSVKCKNCGRRQVFRGYSIFDIRLPKDSCYYCHTPLSKSKNDSNNSV